jgi:hypothetical protein
MSEQRYDTAEVFSVIDNYSLGGYVHEIIKTSTTHSTEYIEIYVSTVS